MTDHYTDTRGVVWSIVYERPPIPPKFGKDWAGYRTDEDGDAHTFIANGATRLAVIDEIEMHARGVA